MEGLLSSFERTAIAMLTAHTSIDADVQRQLASVRSVVRSHSEVDSVFTYDVLSEAQPIVPRDAEMAADLVVRSVGEVSVVLSIEDGFLSQLIVLAPPRGLPENPEILGYAQEP